MPKHVRAVSHYTNEFLFSLVVFPLEPIDLKITSYCVQMICVSELQRLLNSGFTVTKAESAVPGNGGVSEVLLIKDVCLLSSLVRYRWKTWAQSQLG